MEIFIAGNIPSSKNSKQWTGKFLVSSKTVKNYEKTYGFQWNFAENIQAFKKQLEGKEKPYRIGFYFVRDSKRRFDYINALQYPCDAMVKAGWIDDDNADEIIPVILGYHVDKKKAGVVIKVLD